MATGSEGTTTTDIDLSGQPAGWLDNHCVIKLTDTANTAIKYFTVPTFVYNGNVSALTTTQIDNFKERIREEIRGADRVIHKSGATGDAFHRRVTCSQNTSGVWDQIAVRALNINTDRTADGKVNCSDVTDYLNKTAPASRTDTRHMVYVHDSISNGDYCNYAWGTSRVSNAPGTSNPANSTWDVALAQDWESTGISGYSVATTNQEMGHAHSLVNGAGCSSPTTCPPGAEAGNNFHSYDWPDFMNGGGGAYYYGEGYVPPLGYRPQTNCRAQSTAVFGTANDVWTGGYIDCGRDTYWNPSPTTGTWLCSHYNYATDSLYFNKKYTRPATCPG